MRSKSSKSQQGVVLVIGLIFLLVLTLIGTTAMRGTVLQERMAGNVRDYNFAFQGSEATLREIEDQVKAFAIRGDVGALNTPSNEWLDADWVSNEVEKDCTGMALFEPGVNSEDLFGDDPVWDLATQTGNPYAFAEVPRHMTCRPAEELTRGAPTRFFWVVTADQGPSETSTAVVQALFSMR